MSKLPSKLGNTHDSAAWKKVKPLKDYDLTKHLDTLDVLLKFAHKNPTAEQCENIQIVCDKICTAATSAKKNNKSSEKIVEFCDRVFKIAVGTHKIAGDIENELASNAKKEDKKTKSSAGGDAAKLPVKTHFDSVCAALAKCSAHKNKAVTAFCEKDAFVIGEGKTKDGELVGIQAQAKKNLKSYKAFMAALEKLKGKKLPRTEALKAIKKVLYDGSAFIYPMDGGLQAQVGEWKHRAFALHKGNAAEFQKSLAFQIYTAAAMTIQADATIIQKCEGALARED